MVGAVTAVIVGLLQVDSGWGIGTQGPAAPEFLATSVPYATLGCNGVSYLVRTFPSTKEAFRGVFCCTIEKTCLACGGIHDPQHSTKGSQGPAVPPGWRAS